MLVWSLLAVNPQPAWTASLERIPECRVVQLTSMQSKKSKQGIWAFTTAGVAAAKRDTIVETHFCIVNESCAVSDRLYERSGAQGC